MNTGLLGLGSNLGDRRARLQAAVDALPGAGVIPTACSSTYDTDPVGEVPDQPSFLNACVLVQTALEPLELLGDLELAGERMRLPHEQLLSRRFVLIPALELDFQMRTPEGTPLADALAALAPTEGVRWAGPPLRLPGAP